MNQSTFLGRLTADPVIRYTQNGFPVASFDLAVDRRRQKDAEKQTDFFHIVAWRGRAEFAEKYLRRGQQIVVTGELQNRDYMGNDGIKRWQTELIANNIYFAGNRPAETGNESTDIPEEYVGHSDDFMDMPAGDLPF